MTYWLREVVVPPNYAPLTCATYETLTRLYVLPGLGSKRLDKLTLRDVRSWLNKLRDTCQCCAGQGCPPSGETTSLLRQGSADLLSAACFGADHTGRLDNPVQCADQRRHRGADSEERRHPGPCLQAPYPESEAVDG